MSVRSHLSHHVLNYTLFSLSVIHVFRRTVDDKNLIFKQLPENMYPEYHKVYQMMQDPTSYDGYKAYEQHVVADIRQDKRVKLMGPLSCGVAKVNQPFQNSFYHSTQTFVF